MTIWTAVADGIELPAVWAEVQRSNMAKFPGGRAVMNESGKAVKPEGWTPPDIEGVLKNQDPIS